MKTILTFLKIHPKAILFVLTLLLSLPVKAQSGCTDPLANNYDASAVSNDGSCTYNPADANPVSSTQLNATLDENSGLIVFNNTIWTHNDSGNPADIYSINESDLANFSTLTIPGATNVDWEDMAQDATYVYVGDFGNNNGNRTNLKIYRISKSSIAQGTPVVDDINFDYADQTDFTSQTNNNDFDCEAMIVRGNNIYLFTKEWVSQGTTVYAIPKTPGTHSAVNLGSYNVQGLVTAATTVESQQLVVLTGYEFVLVFGVPVPFPFMYLLYDFQNDDFFSGNKRRLSLDTNFPQIEGVATADGIHYYVSNERSSNSFVTIEPHIHEIDLSGFLSNFLSDDSFQAQAASHKPFVVYPNPSRAEEAIQVKIPQQHLGKEAVFELYNAYGQLVEQQNLKALHTTEMLNFNRFSAGLYILKVKVEGDVHSFKLSRI
jgi:hypothetical protein